MGNINNRKSENQINISCCSNDVIEYAPEVGPHDGDFRWNVTADSYLRIVFGGGAAVATVCFLWWINSPHT